MQIWWADLHRNDIHKVQVHTFMLERTAAAEKKYELWKELKLGVIPCPARATWVDITIDRVAFPSSTYWLFRVTENRFQWENVVLPAN